ncbi:MAG: tetratricopeptide repeat protein [Anaerolineae bacterium]|nr:tetratricopeptide repeat protein [Anaerolineae bacterium]
MARGDEHIREAFKADRDRDYLKVVEECEAGLKKGIKVYDEARVYATLGYAYSQLKRYDKALEAHEKSIKADKTSVVAWRYYGITQRMLENLDEAEACYEMALKYSPGDELTLASLGALYVFRDKPMRAIELLEEAVRDGSQSGTTYSNLALAYGKVGRFEEAQEALGNSVSKGYHNWRSVQQRLSDMQEFQSTFGGYDTSWLPAQCPFCNAPTAADTVQWITAKSAKCGYCGSNLKA